MEKEKWFDINKGKKKIVAYFSLKNIKSECWIKFALNFFYFSQFETGACDAN